jgi:alpha-amylase
VDAFDAAGKPVDVGPIAWSTSDPKVVSLNGNGNLRGQAAGTATITATVGGRSASITIQVRPN